MNASQNRLFVLIALGLVGLLVIGLLGIGGYVVLGNLRKVSVRPTPTAVLAEIAQPVVTPTQVPTFTPVPPTPTATLVATNTPVVRQEETNAPAGGATPAAAEQKPPQQAQQQPPQSQEQQPQAEPQAEQEATPQTGFGATEAILLGLGLGAVLIVVRRLRLAG
jgi:cytoskeletal protein RodZ